MHRSSLFLTLAASRQIISIILSSAATAQGTANFKVIHALPVLCRVANSLSFGDLGHGRRDIYNPTSRINARGAAVVSATVLLYSIVMDNLVVIRYPWYCHHTHLLLRIASTATRQNIIIQQARNIGDGGWLMVTLNEWKQEKVNYKIIAFT